MYLQQHRLVKNNHSAKANELKKYLPKKHDYLTRRKDLGKKIEFEHRTHKGDKRTYNKT